MQNWVLFLLNFHVGHGKNINILMGQLYFFNKSLSQHAKLGSASSQFSCWPWEENHFFIEIFINFKDFVLLFNY